MISCWRTEEMRSASFTSRNSRSNSLSERPPAVLGMAFTLALGVCPAPPGTFLGLDERGGELWDLDGPGAGNAAGQAAKAAQRLAENEAVGSDRVLVHVDAVRTAPHLHDDEHLAQLAAERDVAQAHDVDRKSVV